MTPYHPTPEDCRREEAKERLIAMMLEQGGLNHGCREGTYTDALNRASAWADAARAAKPAPDPYLQTR